jgi:hypothetical protein
MEPSPSRRAARLEGVGPIEFCNLAGSRIPRGLSAQEGGQEWTRARFAGLSPQ